MELTDIYTYTGAAIVLILSIFIKIPKLELNVWGWLGKAVGNALNKGVIERLDKTDEKIDKLQTDLDNHIKAEEVAMRQDARYCSLTMSFLQGAGTARRRSTRNCSLSTYMRNIATRTRTTQTTKHFYPSRTSSASISSDLKRGTSLPRKIWTRRCNAMHPIMI